MSGFVWFLIIGLAAGWLAGQVMKTGQRGIIENLVVGVVGALIGGFVMGLLTTVMASFVGKLLAATLGAMLLIFLLRKFRGT